jgi:thiosulfate/3-mercaptopyruvate sulfurtransferase
VSVLDGGLPRWIDDGGEVEMGETPESGGVAQTDYQGGEDRSTEYIRCEYSLTESSLHNLHGSMADAR